LFNKEHALSLARSSIRVTVIVCKPWLPDVFAKGWERYRSLYGLREFEECEGVRVSFVRYLHIPRYRVPDLTVASCSRSILSKIRSLAAEMVVDVIQGHSVWPVGLAAPMVAETLHCPFVITMHIQDDARLVTRSKALPFINKCWIKHRPWWLWDALLSDFYVRGFSDAVEGRLRVIPNGIDLKTIQEGTEKAAQKGIARKRIISVGNLWPVKGIDMNLRALAGLDRIGIHWDSYTVVGDGPERKRLEGLAQELGIARRVHFKGRLTHRETLKKSLMPTSSAFHHGRKRLESFTWKPWPVVNQ